MPTARRASNPSRSSNQAICVLSNRLPFTIQRGPRGLVRKPSSGGLVSALEPVLRARGGTWIGWPGVELRPGESLRSGREPYRTVSVPLRDSEVTHYYHGFSNRTLWPLCHSLPARARFDRRDFAVYERVNRRFGQIAVKESKPGELVWVHDYHLMIAPAFIREGAPGARIAFFLHIPFPPYDIFRLLPWDQQLLQGLLGCDLIGFHISGYAENFLDCAERRLGARVNRDTMLVECGGRSVQVATFPIGIDFDEFEGRAKESPRSEKGGERVVLGVDRLDYTKGIPERIRAFARLLELHPRHRGQVVLLQLAVPSRSQVTEYRELKRQIDELVGQVNGRFATATWSPIRYLHRSYTPEQLAALYRDADVGLVTPLRDGMNLVAKEYVACQVEDPGVLVLSRLAGAAETMREAILVNPYNIDRTAEQIHRALTMEETERRSRMESLRRRERRDNVHAWVRSFLEAAHAEREVLSPVTEAEIEGWLGRFLTGYRLALFLDYDGTLSPIVDHPSKARLSAHMRAHLEACADRPDTDIAIVSGRSLEDIRGTVQNPGLIYAGNHGLEISGPQIEPFEYPDAVHYRARLPELAKSLAEVCVEGAWVESKGHTLTYHFRTVDESHHKRLAERARELILEAGFQARDAHRALEARPPIGWDKGQAVLQILRMCHGPGWPEDVRVIYIGDDQTDEDAFRVLAGMAVTFRVGAAGTLTAASRRLPNVEAVETLLRWLSRRDTAGNQAALHPSPPKHRAGSRPAPGNPAPGAGVRRS